MGVRVLALIPFLAVGLCGAEFHICPLEFAAKIQDVFGQTNNVQQGVWHRLPCPSFREGESLFGVIWRNVSKDGNTVRLMTHSTSGDFPVSDRYGISSGLSLLIKGVELSDEGRYQCEVIPRDTLQRIGEIDINVIGDFFPASSSDKRTTVSCRRGRRQTLPCQCAPQSPDRAISVVYWSTGEGVTSDKNIIAAARFSDGAVLQFQHGADYSIDADNSLMINSLNALHDNQRFWCHVFKLDGSLSNCLVDVTASAGRPSVDALRASAASFYLRKGMEQVLPCTSWEPGLTTCGIRWLKIGTSSQLLLNYTVADGVVGADDAFDLAGEFGLVIRSVEDDHAGKYSCAADSGRTEDIVVRVIGDEFPLDGGRVSARNVTTFEPKSTFTLSCLAELDSPVSNQSTVIWSFGSIDAQRTSVIGILSLPGGSVSMSDLGGINCYNMTLEGSLILNNCSQDGDVRYWCHVFPYDDLLYRSYVDVVVKTECADLDLTGDAQPPSNFPVLIVVVVCVCLLMSIVLIVIVVMVCKHRKKQTSSKDPERGGYELIEKEALTPESDVFSLASKVKLFMVSTMGRLPITPWVDWEQGCYVPTYEVYTPLELFVNGSVAGISVRYRLESESEIFDDNVSKPTSSTVVVQGRAGCGKTTFLYKLAFDWYNKKSDAVLHEEKLVFVLPSAVLVKAGNLGEAVLRHMLPQNTKILAASINEYCKQHPDDVAILVDGCDEKEMKSVMKIMKDQDLLKCKVVITTRHAQLAQEVCQEHNLRHVTISGFTFHNAHEYVQKIIAFEEQKSTKKIQSQMTSGKAQNRSSEVKARKSPTTDESVMGTEGKICPEAGKEKEGANGKNEPNDINIDNGINNSDDGTDAGQVLTSNAFGKSLHSYLDSGILHPRVACLPANLTALCRLSIWTKGEALRSKASMRGIVTQLVKCMFDKSYYRAKYCADIQATAKSSEEEGREAKLTREQQYILVSLGRHALQMICGTCFEGPGTFPKPNVLYSSEVEKDILEAGIKAGFLCCEEAVGADPETDTSGEDATLLPSQSENRKVYFVLEILQEFCAGIYMVHTTESVSTWMDVVSEINIRTNVDKLGNVLMFACLAQCSSATRSAIQTYIKKGIKNAQKQVSGKLIDVLQLQKLVELCLQLNAEGQCEDSGSSVIEAKTVRLIGVSSHKIRLLSFLLEQARRYIDKSKEDRSEVKKEIRKAYEDLRSIELFRMGSHDWSELRPYLEDFAPGVFEGTVSEAYEVLPSTKEANTSKLLRERIERSDDMPSFPSDQSDVTFLHTVQSLGLQELIESQAGECHSSRSAQELAFSLPKLKMLKSIVLYGTILSSDNLCDFVSDLDKLPNLQKLDLRLNKQFDDKAFAAIINSLHACKNLTDLRLSLYRVTSAGFQYVRDKNEKEKGLSWSRLKTLYLLHGSSAKTFVAFLADSLKYFHLIEHFHISDRTPREEMPVCDVELFDKNMTNQDLMTNLKELNIGNMEELKPTLASLKVR